MSKVNKKSVLSLLTDEKQIVKINLNDNELFIKKLSTFEQIHLMNLKNSGISDSEFLLHYIAYSLCDETGKRLFDDNDIDELSNMTAQALETLVAHINELNEPMAKDDIKKN